MRRKGWGCTDLASEPIPEHSHRSGCHTWYHIAHNDGPQRNPSEKLVLLHGFGFHGTQQRVIPLLRQIPTRNEAWLWLRLHGKESACQSRRRRRHRFNPWSGKSPGGGNDNPLHCSCLEKAMDRGVWWAGVHGVAKSWTRLRRHAHDYELILADTEKD